MNTIILGKNSTLYNKIKNLLKIDNLIEKSYKEIDTIQDIDNVIVFSFDPASFLANRRILDFLLNKNPKKLIYISTTAIFSNQTTNKYKYPRIKKEIENYLIRFNNVCIIRVGMVEGLFNPLKFTDSIKYTSLEFLGSSIEKCINDKSSTKIVEAWEKRFIENQKHLTKYIFYTLKFLKRCLKSRFYYTRPIDLILKLLGEQNYGYTYLSNQFNFTTRNTVLGSGMAALGVIEALEEKNELHETYVIHAQSSKTNFYESSNPQKFIETIGNGGNSNLWHSVISIFSKNDNYMDIYESFFKKFFPQSAKKYKLLKKYSFIPYFPIRPLRKIKHYKKRLKDLIDDYIIYIETDEQGYIYIHGLKSSYRTQNLKICTGSYSTLKLLYDSGFISTPESTLSEHLVGYYGQFKGYLKRSQIYRTRNGHFKRFHEIKLDDRKLYVNFRPANFTFKNLIKANNFRSFFSNSSKSIFFSLITKFNLSLIIEALYNKFGIQINFSNIYNIVGHIESKNTVSITCNSFSDPFINYNEKNVVFTKEEKKTIYNYLNDMGIIYDIMISNNTPVSPGLHFLNSSICNELLDLPNGIAYFGTMLFKDESPKHPTFDLFIYSYLSTKQESFENQT